MESWHSLCTVEHEESDAVMGSLLPKKFSPMRGGGGLRSLSLPPLPMYDYTQGEPTKEPQRPLRYCLIILMIT